MKKSLHNLTRIALIPVVLMTAVVIGMSSCEESSSDLHAREKRDGYVPIYGTGADREISFQNPRQISDPGRIYVYGKYLLINENNEGIHVYNNQDPASPQPVGFIRILGSFDMAVKDNILYAGHFGSITAIDLNSFSDLQVKETLTLDEWNYGVAPPAGEYFECADVTKGPVVGWEKVNAKVFECYAIR